MKGPVKTWSMPAAAAAEKTVDCALCGGTAFRPAWDCGAFAFVACTGCGLKQRNPQPLRSAVDERYRDRFSADYLQYELANEAAFLRLQRLALADIGFAELETAMTAASVRPKFLDVGCAAGALLDWLRGRGWETAGVELCAASAAYARGRGLNVIDGRLEDAGLPEASGLPETADISETTDLPEGGFDIVHASHLIEHLNDPRSFLRAARRRLKPDGRLLIATPNAAGFQARLFGARWRSAIFDHLYLFTKRQLAALLESEGFVVERSATWGGLAAGTAPAPVKRIADAAAKRWGFGDVMIVRSRIAPQ